MNKFISFIATSLLTLDILSVLNTPLQAQEKNSCAATATNVQNLIEKGREVEVSVHSFDISQEYPDHLENRPYSYEFVLKGGASTAIMSSPNFMKIIANQIVSDCKDVSLVVFVKAQSDIFEKIGLMPDGEMKFFDCIDLDLNSNERQIWGKMICR